TQPRYSLLSRTTALLPTSFHLSVPAFLFVSRIDALLGSAVKSDNAGEVQGPIKQTLQIKPTRTSSSSPSTPRSRSPRKEEFPKKEEVMEKENDEFKKKLKMENGHPREDSQKDALRPAVSAPIVGKEADYERLYKDSQSQVPPPPPPPPPIDPNNV